MKIRRRMSFVMAVVTVAASVFIDAAPVYGAQDAEGGLNDAVLEAAGELTVKETAVEPVDAAPVMDAADNAGEINDVMLPAPGELADEQVLEDSADISGNETGADGDVQKEQALVTVGNFTYSIDDYNDEATVVGWNGIGTIEIPRVIELPADYNSGRINDDHKRDVVAIGENAFAGENASKVTEITIPDNIKKIGAAAFKDCTNLKTVIFPDSMDEISQNAFSGCTSLAAIKLPKKLKALGLSVFAGSGLTSVEIPMDMDVNDVKISSDKKTGPFSGATSLKNIVFEAGIKKIPANLFAGCTSVEQVHLPENMTTVGANAFINCTGLKRLTMSDDITDIGDSAFEGCGLTGSVALSPYLKNIGKRAFYNCASLNSVSIPDNIRTIDSYAFAKCTLLTTATFDEGDKKGIEGGLISDHVFSECTSLREIIIPNSFKRIGNYAFEKCESLTEMTLKKKFNDISFDIVIGQYAFANDAALAKVTLEEDIHLVTIERNAFSGCISLLAIRLPDCLKTLGMSAFEGCTSLYNVTLSRGLIDLGAAAFRNDSSLREIEIPKSITKVGTARTEDGVFYGCEKLKTVTFENGIVTIPDNILWGTGSLENMAINSTVTDIGNHAFDNCVILSDLTIPTSVVSIGNFAFNNCRKLVDNSGSLIPASVRTIGDNAFSECVKLSSASLKEGLEKLGKNAFKDCTKMIRAYVPDSTTTVGSGCFEGCTQLEEVHLPKDMNAVPDSMFKECVSLAKVNLSREKLTTIGTEAFYNCDSLTHFNDENTIDFSGYKVLSEIKKGAFQKCDRITALKLSPATDKLGDYAFDNCNLLSDISLGTRLSTIPSNAFSNLTSLKKMVIPRNVTTIKTKAFENDNNLEEIHIPKTTQTLEPNIFSYFDKLTVYVVDGSPAHEYVVKYKIYHQIETVYVDSINFVEDTVEVDEKGKIKPVIEILPVHHSVDVTYSSSDETIFTVDESGTVTGVAAGTATLTATAPGNAGGTKRSDYVTIRVRKPVTGVTLDITSIKVGIGEKFMLTATVSPDDATDKSIRWSSSDEAIAYVDSKGMVYPKKKGTANITVTTNNQKKTAVCKVEVDSGILDAPEEWKGVLDPPFADPTGDREVAKGTRITLSCREEGARIYYTTDGSEPVADYTGRMVSGTKQYTRPITITKNTTIRAFAICTGFKYSKDASFTYFVNDPWGDVTDESLRSRFGNKVSNVPSGMWYAFKDDTGYYTSSSVTKYVRDYTGGEQVFNSGIYVFNGTDRLIENRDYNIAYKNNVDARSASAADAPTVTVKGMGSFSGAQDLAFTIAAADINAAALMTGKVIALDAGKTLKTVSPLLSFRGRKLVEGTDYELTYYKGSVADANKVKAADKAEVGDYYIVISAKSGGNFKGICTEQVRIKAVDSTTTNVVMMSSVKVNVPDVPWNSTGIDVKKLFADGNAYVTVKKGNAETKLIYGTDYTVDNVDAGKYPLYPDAGTYTFLLHGTEANTGDCCIGDASGTLVIKGIDNSKVAIACIETKPVYTGSVFKLSDLFKADASKGYTAVTLYNKETNEVLTQGTDYDVDMTQAAPYGKFDVVFNLKGRYEGRVVSTIAVSACDITDPKITVKIDPAPFCKAGAVPDVTISYNSKILKEGVDYTLDCKKNTKIPTSTALNKQPTVTIKGKGCFKGSRTEYFTIVKAPVSVLNLFVADQKYKEGKKASYYIKKPKVQDSGKTVASKDIQKLVKSDFKYYNAMTGEQLTGSEILPIGTMIEVRARVTAGASGSYEGSYELRDTYRIVDPEKFINKAKVKIQPMTYAGGEEVVPAKNSDITVTLNNVKLSSSDYEIVFITNNCNPGTAKVTLAGCGEYGGTKKATFRIK